MYSRVNCDNSFDYMDVAKDEVFKLDCLFLWVMLWTSTKWSKKISNSAMKLTLIQNEGNTLLLFAPC